MKKRIVAFTLMLMMVFSISSMAASSFTDITEETHAWAYDAVMEMNEKGIIKGTSETTFAPDSNVTRIQALLLIARILGYNSEAVTQNIKAVYNAYSEELSSLSTTYKNELAFLAAMGIFSVEDFQSMELSEEVTREEAALFLAKADGVKEDDLATSFKDLFSDNSSIKAEFKPYVYYVRDKGYMNGVGEGMFSPATAVTRAQIATMLYRIMPNITYELKYMSVGEISNGKVDIYIAPKTYELPKTAVVKNKGEEMLSSNLYSNLNGFAKVVNGVITEVYVFFDAPVVSKEVDGLITHIGTSTEIIQIEDIDDETRSNYNLLADRYKITINGEESRLSQLRTGDYVVLGLDKAGRIVTATVADTNKELTDLTIESIEMDNTNTMMTVKDKDGNTYTYDMNKSDPVIRRNGNEVEFSSLNEGDKISKLQLLYNRVKSIDVFSEISDTKGAIKAIHIADESYIVISNSGVESTINLNKDTKYYVFGESKTIYDLQLGHNVSVTLDGKLVSKVEVTLVSQTTDVKGTVVAVNTSGGFITVQTVEGETVVVYVSTKATSATKIIDNNSVSALNKTLKNIDTGANITAIGAMVNGVFEASTIVYSNN